MALILQTASENDDEIQTRIMYEAFLSYRQPGRIRCFEWKKLYWNVIEK
jgi:hypothetical protein